MNLKDGVLDEKYLKKRKKFSTYRFRMIRRAYECALNIDKYVYPAFIDLLDIGAADGSFYNLIKKFIPYKKINYTGLEYNFDLIKNSKIKNKLVAGDATKLPFKKKFDVIIATAIVEHIENKNEMFKEFKNMLKEDGIIIITMPDPFFEKIASVLGNIEDGDYHRPLTLENMKKLCKKNDLKVLKYEKFMITPFGFVFEKILEPFIPDIFKFNQIFIIKKK